MTASGVTAPLPFAQERMLASLLLARGRSAATDAFPLQVSLLGADWLTFFFDAFAECVRRRTGFDADMQAALGDCLAPLTYAHSSAAQVVQLTREISDSVALKAAEMSVAAGNITREDLAKFLALFDDGRLPAR